VRRKAFGTDGRCIPLFAAIALAGSTFADAAVAADMPVPVHKTATKTAYDWSGFYVGGHLGGGISGDWNGTTAREPVSAVQWDVAFGQRASGFIGGGHVGYNWQFAPRWVLGIEADLSWAGLHDSTRVAPFPTTGGAGAGTFGFMGRDIDWIGTVRGRFGHASDRWLAFVTGGFAFGRVSFTGDVNFTSLGGVAFPVSFDDTQLGWTVGGGFEHALPVAPGNWTVRAEYLYYALGPADANALPVPFAAGTTSHYRWNETTVHVFRLGLSYKFDSLAAR
jgi:outer membrane immunogenic protein